MSDTPRRRRSLHPLRRVALLTGLVLLLGSCSLVRIDNKQNSWDPHGPIAERIDNLFWPVFWIAVGIFVLVQGGIIVAMILFRDRPGRKMPKQIHGNAKLEVTWTVIPALILATIAVPTVRTVFDLTKCEAGSLPVNIVGHQWWFEYQYPDLGIDTANVMVIPVDTPVCASMTSADVIHNFWVPELNGKRYLIPGQDTVLPLEASDPGEYWAQCGEFCGLSHSLMRGRVIALPQADFDAWVEAQRAAATEPAPGSAAAEGLQVFQSKGCTACHSVNYGPDSEATNLVASDAFHGPNLTHFASRDVFGGAYLPRDGETRDEALTAWLSNPPGIKPGSFMPNLGLTEQEIDSLISWLETLK